MTTTTKHFAAAGALLLAVLAVYAFAYPLLPDRIPIHWTANGSVNGYGPRYVLLLLGPGLMLAEMLLFGVLPKLSPKRFDMDGFMPTYLYLMLVLVALSAYLFGTLLWAALVGPEDMHRVVLGGVAVLFVLIGNVMGKVRRNFFIGVRTPWTLASERVWYSTHRMAAKTWVAGGLLCLLWLLLNLPAWGSVALVSAAALLPVAYSLVYYKRLEKRGELEG